MVYAASLMTDVEMKSLNGKTQLGDKVEVLAGRRITAFPDIDGYDKWKEKVDERPYLNIQVSDYLQKNSAEEDRRAGIDIADILIRWYSTSENVDSPEDKNPIAKEIRRCFSPQYYDEVMALVEELDLEIVGVTRRM